MKSRLLILLILLNGVFAGHAMDQESDRNIIEGASYYIIQGSEKDFLRRNMFVRRRIARQRFIPRPTHATFYNASGDEVRIVSMEELYNSRIDPKAPKPKPMTYAIKYWLGDPAEFGIGKGVPGYFVIFTDKNGNDIRSYRYNEETKKIIVSYSPKREISIADLTDLDMQDCIEKDSDPIRDMRKKQKSDRQNR